MHLENLFYLLIPIYIAIGISFAHHYVTAIYPTFVKDRLSKFIFWILWIGIVLLFPIYLIVAGILLGISKHRVEKMIMEQLNKDPETKKQIERAFKMEWLDKATKKGHNMQPYQDKKNMWRCSKCGRFITLNKINKPEGTAVDRPCNSRK
jgi:hypothetical protein